jgi:hypothetical protein
MRRIAQRVVLAVSAPVILVACATIGPPQPPSLELPQAPTDLRASRKGDKVNLTWTIPTMTTDRETLRSMGPTHICRGSGELQVCDTPVAQIKTPVTSTVVPVGQKPKGTYTDTLSLQMESDDPSALIFYAVQVSNREDRAAGLSNQVRVSAVRTLPSPREFRASVAKHGVVLSWTGETVSVSPADMQYVYRVYRRAEGSNERVLAGETSVGPESSLTVTDANIEWQKFYFYSAEAVTLIRAANNPPREVEGDDTPEIKIFADDVFPPEVPAELQAVFSGPGQKPFIDLVWAPVSDADLAGYNVYRHEDGASPVKLNRELVKAPAYSDANVASQKNYLYSVSAVDVRGNESARSEEANERVP